MSSEPRVVAILKRDNEGHLKRVQSVELQKGERTIQLPTKQGVILVVGKVYAHDDALLKQVIKDIESEPIH